MSKVDAIQERQRRTDENFGKPFQSQAELDRAYLLAKVKQWKRIAAEGKAKYDKLEATIRAVEEVHEPIEAVMYSGKRQYMVKVCTGCGQDDGNWQRWPCPTIRAIERSQS